MIGLNNVATTDTYTDANTREQPLTVRVNLYIYNAAIYYRLMRPDRTWTDELYLAPGERSLDRRCRGAQIRSAAAGKPAQVTLELLTAVDLP